ncbi:medium chain dehydrogenase/reductase family protein [Gammaproteobacteria bacterium AB-CW1]|uniref:Medium chain dehydrogenase/reductase family protein n=2 Tax=Natronospira TaxID=2024969 RepID=A0AAP6MMY2_9GAMM|nr:medium chain dehydrogenase/reductase family protein [Gammaproteobacteria bacterium AB-CW1]
MIRVRIAKPGGYERLAIESAPDPAPGPGEVVIESKAIGVNFADCIARMGLYKSAREFVGWPLTPGFEVAGRVAALGEGVSDFAVGQRVFALSLFDAYASKVCVPIEQLRPIPGGWSEAQAAGFPTVFLTAWYALHELGGIRAGDRVLVHSAAGGVGQALVQLALDAGARPVAVIGASHKREALAGYDIPVIDKSREPLWAAAEDHAPDGYDLIADANGYPTLAESYRHLAAGGRLLIYGFHGMFRPDRKGRGRVNWPAMIAGWLRTPRFNPLRLTSDNRSVMGFNLSFMGEHRDVLGRGLDHLVQRAEAGRLQALPVTSYPFEAVARAHRDLESGQTTGKLVLLPDQSAD